MSMLAYPIGRLNGVDAEVGTLLGPGPTGELYVVSARDAAGVLVSVANAGNIEDARAAVQEHGPRSMTEGHLR